MKINFLTIFIAICLILSIILVSGCIEQIEGNVRFSLLSKLDNPPFEGAPRYDGGYLLLMTEKEYPCILPLNYTVDKNGNKFIIRILGVEKEQTCQPSVSPAMGMIFLNLTNGEYILQFEKMGRIDKYSLNVSDESYQIKPMVQNFMIMNQKQN
jgi:hypothetical protein